MSAILRCDACGKEQPQTSNGSVPNGWYSFTSWGQYDIGQRHLCSATCIETFGVAEQQRLIAKALAEQPVHA